MMLSHIKLLNLKFGHPRALKISKKRIKFFIIKLNDEIAVNRFV